MSYDKSVICPILIGRASAVQVIGRRLDSVRSGNGQVVVLAGEAGLGKSRLAAEVKRIATHNNWLILQGNCFEPDCTLPYAPFLDLLRAFCSTRSNEEVAREFGPTAWGLAKLLPELSTLVREQTSERTVEPEHEKRHLFQALGQFFIRLATAQPLILILEDLHWSDDTSLEFLLHLARRIAAQPILLLLTYRSDELHAGLSRFLAELDRERLAVELSLTRLTLSEVDRMLRAIFDFQRPVRTEFLETIYELTEGNPFFIEEVCKSLIAAGDIFFTQGRWDRKPLGELHIPRSVQEAVSRRSEQLGEGARQVLVKASVVGRRFDFALLQALTLHSERELLQHIKALIAAQLVVEETAERFAFRHALTREAVYSSLLARERKSLHQVIGETLERLYTASLEAHLSDLAYHFFEAGLWAKAFEYSQQAGEKARALYASSEAVEHFTRALEAARQLAMLAPWQVYRARGQTYETVGEFERAQTDYEAVLQISRTAQDRGAEWLALLDLGFLWAARDYAKTGQYFRQALALARSMGDPTVLGKTLNRMGNWHANADQPLEALRHHQEALDIFEELNDRPGLAETFDLMGLTTAMDGDWVHSQVYYEQAIALFRELNDQRGLASAHAILAEQDMSFYSQFMPEMMILPVQALAHAQESVKLAREIGWRSGEAYALIVLGGLWESQGEYERALSFVQAGLELAQEIEHGQWMTIGHLDLGGIYLSLLAFDVAQEHLEQGLANAQETHSVNFVRQCAVALALACILRNDLARAAKVLDSAFSPGTETRTFTQQLYGYACAELALAQGDAAQALSILDELIASVPNAITRTVVPRLWKLRGEALMALGRLSEAETALLAANKSVAARGMRPPELEYRIALGRVYRLQRRRDQAEAEFEAARTIIGELAANIPDEALRNQFRERALARIPALAPPSSLRTAKKEFGGLTARERQVAALIAQGNSNREIAAALVVGERTIETHVAHILSKLGFDSRTQIAVWAVEMGLPQDDR
jgi:tetratricopeptide (TPR) repeat protein